MAGDINGDGLPDVVVGNKRGTFVHLHQKKTVTQEEWEKAQPKRERPPGYAEVDGLRRARGLLRETVGDGQLEHVVAWRPSVR